MLILNILKGAAFLQMLPPCYPILPHFMGIFYLCMR